MTIDCHDDILFITLHGLKILCLLIMTIDCHDDILCHIIYSNFSGTIYLPSFLAPHDSPWGLDVFSYKKLRAGETRFRDNGSWSSYQKNLFSTIWHLCENFICHIVALMALARSRIVTHGYTASFSWKLVLCKTNNIFYSLGNGIWQKMNYIFWNYIKKKKVRSRGTVFVILLMSAVICV